MCPEAAYDLAEQFWPGPLTMILPRKANVPDRTTGGLDTVGVRCPDHPVTLAIIEAAGVPIAAPSANTSGRPSCTTAQDVLEDMNGKIARHRGRRPLRSRGGVYHLGFDLSPRLSCSVLAECLWKPWKGWWGRSRVDHAVTGQLKPEGEAPVPQG